MWAGDLYHQVMANTLTQHRRGIRVELALVQKLVRELAAAQYDFSAKHLFMNTAKSHAETYMGLPVFLALFEHTYELPTDGLLEKTQEDVCAWVEHTFAWDGWHILLQRIRSATDVHIEPQYLNYFVGGARISARMDVGTELASGQFHLYDWKCYSENERFAEYNQELFRHQLLAYALWPARRAANPQPIRHVTAHVYNPINSEYREVHFTETDVCDFEIEVGRWARVNERLFTDITEVEFDELDGPYDPQRSCPHCPFKAVCRQEITWHRLT